ncbi:hypothetical protein GH5_01476 [Leishmania sp. Ghana 2012 LV757]|uniref:hypothetical protein n=1 Tax=Leishmania sp. Ghana 2012 LV757 TaxID=2803181 RepID=UPI001B450B51|nr:hypothetical protein GH5_01476 [Leishmania sp. Ghana 2012 LV757]
MAASHSGFGKAEPYASTRGEGQHRTRTTTAVCAAHPLRQSPLGSVLSTTCVVSAMATASSPVQ